MLEITQSIGKYDDLNDLMEQIIKRAKSFLDAEAISIILPDEKGKEFNFSWAENIDPSKTKVLKTIKIPLNAGIAGSVYKTGRPELINEVQNDPRHYRKLDEILGFRTESMIAIPIQGKEKTLGVLEVINKIKGVFDKEDFNLAMAIASISGIVLENAQIHEKLNNLVSQLRKSEEELRMHRDQLEKLLEERTEGLRRVNERLQSEILERKHAEEERERLRSRIQMAQKMEAIATLAGGIAHKFNNALTVVMGNIELLEMEFPTDETLWKYTSQMKSIINKMSRLTSQLVAYARGGKYQPEIVSLNKLIKDYLPSIIKKVRPSIEVETDLSSDLLKVEVDTTQFQMVLSALITNASEAIEEEGKILIKTTNEKVNEEEIKEMPGLKPGPYVSFTVEDNGKGMDEFTKERIFEPFFTTKIPGRGLGMSAVYGIVKNHDGWISIDSEPNKGTRVRILLPALP